MSTPDATIFWDLAFVAVALPQVAVYVGYPALLFLMTRLQRRSRSHAEPPALLDDSQLPSVSLLVAAYNEEAVIEQKIRNFFALDYPAERLDLSIVSDASSDRTCELAQRLLDSMSPSQRARVTIHDRRTRSGKTVALSETVPGTRGEIIVFTDANSMYLPDAVRLLAQGFRDPRVGLVCGNLSYLGQSETASQGEALYWRYENVIKSWEGELGRLLVANGSIYAFRRELFEPIPGPVADDMVMPLVVSTRGYRTIYESRAIAEERLAQHTSEDFRSKARIVAQGYEVVRRYRGQMFGQGAFRFTQYVLHKVLRWLELPLMGLMLLVSILGSGAFLQFALVLQLCFYGLAVAGFLLRNSKMLPDSLRIPFYFCLVNAAALKGLIDFLRGRSRATWEKSESTRGVAKRRVLFFSHYFPPEGNAPASRVYEMSKRWVRSGVDVTVITCAPNVPSGKLYEGYENKLSQREEIDGIHVIRIWTFLAANEGTTLRIANYLSYMVAATLRALFLPRPDLVIATSPQFFCGWAGVLIKWLRGTPLILEIRDIWPESIVAVGAMESRALISLLEWLEVKMYAAATRIVAVGDGYRDQLIEKQAPREKITVITNGVDREFFRPMEPDLALKAQLGLADKFVCSYVGTIGMACGLDITLRAARLLRARGIDDIVFLLIGDGAVRATLEDEARRDRLGNVMFLGRQEKELIPRLLSVSDCCLVHLRRTDLFRTVLPSKIFEAAAMKRPIVMGVAGHAAQVVEESRGGICIEPENEHELVAAVSRLRFEEGLRERMGAAGYDYVIANYDRDRLSEDYLKLIEQVLQV